MKFLIFEAHSELKAESGGRPLGAFIANFKMLAMESMGFDT